MSRAVLLICFSFAVSISASQSIEDSLSNKEPLLRILYNGKDLTSDVIKNAKFRDGQLVPLEVVLEIASKYDSNKDVSVVIENIEVIFIVYKSSPRRKTKYPGHSVFLPVLWPEEFPINEESSILFKLRYKYFRKDQPFDSGMMTKRIAIE